MNDESIQCFCHSVPSLCLSLVSIFFFSFFRDCPNDINEAVSTLIYSSARLGDLPELLMIRKLFGERYGQRFAAVALDLLPGNLVNRQVNYVVFYDIVAWLVYIVLQIIIFLRFIS